MDKNYTEEAIETKKIKTKNESQEQIQYEPSYGVINNILNYSKALKISSSKTLEYFETVLN